MKTNEVTNLWIGTGCAPLRLPRFRTSVHVVSVDPILILRGEGKEEKLSAKLSCARRAIATRTHPEFSFFDHSAVFHDVINRNEKVMVLEMRVKKVLFAGCQHFTLQK